MKGSCGYFMSRVPNFGLQLITPRSTHIIPTPITIMFILCGRYVQWTIIVHCVSTEELGRVFHHNISKGKKHCIFCKILVLYFWFVIVKASKWSMVQCGCFLKASHDVMWRWQPACRRSFINERIIGHRHLRLLWFVRHIFQNCPLYGFCVFYKYQIHWNYRNIDWKC